ncbi:hypothetical protein N2152v2_001151 [Parachlorella kessleri]
MLFSLYLAAAPGEANTDDDFQASPNLASQRQQAAAGAGGAAHGGAGSSEGPSPQLGAVPPKLRRHIYKFMSARLQDKKLGSELGKAVIQEVVAQLPPGAVDSQRVQQIFEEQKKVAEKRREALEAKLQQQQSQELPPAQQQGQQSRQQPAGGQQQHAPAQQQQQLQQQQEEQPRRAAPTVKQEGQRQQQQQQEPEPGAARSGAGGVAALAAQRGATAAAAAVAAAKPAADAPAPPPPGRAGAQADSTAGDRPTKKPKGMARQHLFSDDPHLFAEMAIKKAAEAAASGKAVQPAAAAKPQQLRQQAVLEHVPLRIVSVPVVPPRPVQPSAQPLQQGLVPGPAALPAAAAAPAANELSVRSSQGAAVDLAPALDRAQVEAALQLGSGSLPAAGPLPAPPPPPGPRVTDEQLAAVKAGAQEDAVRELLAKVISTGRKWDARIVRVLMLHGSQGLGPTAAQHKAKELGFVGPEESGKWQTQKRMRSDGLIAHVGKSQYALRCFPGVEDTPTQREKDAAEEEGKMEPAPA